MNPVAIRTPTITLLSLLASLWSKTKLENTIFACVSHLRTACAKHIRRYKHLATKLYRLCRYQQILKNNSEHFEAKARTYHSICMYLNQYVEDSLKPEFMMSVQIKRNRSRSWHVSASNLAHHSNKRHSGSPPDP